MQDCTSECGGSSQGRPSLRDGSRTGAGNPIAMETSPNVLARLAAERASPGACPRGRETNHFRSSAMWRPCWTCSLARNEDLAPEDSPTSCINCWDLRDNGTFVPSTHISNDLEVAKWANRRRKGSGRDGFVARELRWSRPNLGRWRWFDAVGFGDRSKCFGCSAGCPAARPRWNEAACGAASKATIVAWRRPAGRLASLPRSLLFLWVRRAYFFGRDSGGTTPFAR